MDAGGGEGGGQMAGIRAKGGGAEEGIKRQKGKANVEMEARRG